MENIGSRSHASKALVTNKMEPFCGKANSWRLLEGQLCTPADSQA